MRKTFDFGIHLKKDLRPSGPPPVGGGVGVIRIGLACSRGRAGWFGLHRSGLLRKNLNRGTLALGAPGREINPVFGPCLGKIPLNIRPRVVCYSPQSKKGKRGKKGKKEKKSLPSLPPEKLLRPKMWP